MKRLLILLVLLLLNLSVIPSFAVSWVQLDDNNYIDKDSIKFYVNDYGAIDYNKRIFWTKYEGNDIYKDIERTTKSKIQYVLSQFIVDYSNNTIAIKADMAYDKDGKTVASCTYNDFQLQYSSIAPNSNAELWANLVKKPRALKKMYKWQKLKLQQE